MNPIVLTTPAPDPTTHKLVLLHQATEALSQTWQFEEALKVVLTKARELTGAVVSVIYLADQGRRLDRHSFLTSQSDLVATPNELFWFDWAEQVALTQTLIRVEQNRQTTWATDRKLKPATTGKW
jgi:GAF domain-containing protein